MAKRDGSGNKLIKFLVSMAVLIIGAVALINLTDGSAASSEGSIDDVSGVEELASALAETGEDILLWRM